MTTQFTAAALPAVDTSPARRAALPADVVAAIESAPRGEYQRDLLAGTEAWSGATLRRRAQLYGARYEASRRGLVARICAALPPGWSASSELVTYELGGARRARRELVVRGPGVAVMW